VDRLGDGLAVEAWASDGTIEAIRPTQASNFALGVQWHPEWKYWEDRFSTALLQAFGLALNTQALSDGGRP
jgi:putative glutamine amidotransferase